jgi:hypothetical protein
MGLIMIKFPYVGNASKVCPNRLKIDARFPPIKKRIPTWKKPEIALGTQVSPNRRGTGSIPTRRPVGVRPVVVMAVVVVMMGVVVIRQRITQHSRRRDTYRCRAGIDRLHGATVGVVGGHATNPSQRDQGRGEGESKDFAQRLGFHDLLIPNCKLSFGANRFVRVAGHKFQRAAATRCSLVIPSSFIATPPGALMPKRSMPSTLPVLPTYFHQRALTPASIAMRLVQALGKTLSR